MTFPKSQHTAGDPESRILILGQAPSFMEVRQGEPLVGPAGTIFNECLAKVGLARRSCYVVNLWEEPVYTDRRTGKIYQFDGGPLLWGNRLTDLGRELAMPAMKRIRESGANVILALGQQALELVTGKHKEIMKWRGSLLWSDTYERKVIATVHPAAVIHGQYIWKYLIINDLKKALDESVARVLLLPQRDILIEPTFDEVMDAFALVRSEGVVATDLEGVNQQVSCFCLCTSPSKGLVVPFVDDAGDYWSLEEEKLIWLEYARTMYDREIMKVNQNLVGFDAPFLLLKASVMTRGPIGDTMIGYGMLYPEFPKDLGFLGSIYTREPFWKDEGKLWKTIGDATGDKTDDYRVFWRYNGKDGCVALECWYPIEEELKQVGFWPQYQEAIDTMAPILFMTALGLHVSRDEITAANYDLNNEIEQLEAELDACSEKKFNPNSTKQCAEYFYGLKKIKPYINHKTGNITTDDMALSRIYRKTGLPEAKYVQDIRNKKKLKSTYMEVEFDSDGRLRCSWNTIGTWTRRFSSSKTIAGTGMNLQNIDPRFKRFIVQEDR